MLAAVTVTVFGCTKPEEAPPTSSSGKKSADYTDPEKYYGTYVGRRVDLEDPAMAPSTEELIGSSILTLHDGNSTYTMTHEGLTFGGNYVYIVGKNEQGARIKVMELYIYQVEGFSKSALIGGKYELGKGGAPATEELLKRYEDIMLNISWRFEILEDGFRQIDSDKGPGMYVFKRDDSKAPLEQNSGEDINPGVGGS